MKVQTAFRYIQMGKTHTKKYKHVNYICLKKYILKEKKWLNHTYFTVVMSDEKCVTNDFGDF